MRVRGDFLRLTRLLFRDGFFFANLLLDDRGGDFILGDVLDQDRGRRGFLLEHGTESGELNLERVHDRVRLVEFL